MLFHTDNAKFANEANIASIIQPGGSINDKKVIDETDKKNMSWSLLGKVL